MAVRLLHHFLTEAALRNPDRHALVEGEKRATYGELAVGVERLAQLLVGEGLDRGDRVALLAHNSRFYVEAYHAVLAAGGIAVPINPATDARSLAFFVRDSGARFLAFGAGTERTVQRARDDLQGVELLLSERARILPDLPAQMRSVAADRATDSAAGRLESFSDEAIASIVYTSGSTGRPRGAMLSHRNLVSNALAIQAYLRLEPDDRVLAVLPFCYIYGKSVLHTHLLAGATVVIENRFLYPQTVLETMERESCTGLSGVPSTFAILLHRSTFAERPPASLRYITQAGGPMSPSLTRRLMEVLGGRKIYIMYGATEASGRLSYLPPEDLVQHVGSIGRPVDGVTFTLVKEDGSVAAAGEVGELVASGPNIMQGYWAAPDETALVLDELGYRTGDLARRVESGYYEIVGRKKDMIKAGAHRISPKEIEEAILEFPDVYEVAVIGIPDEVLGEAIWAVVVSKSGDSPEEPLSRFLRDRLPQYKLPSGYEWRTGLPKNPSGKPMKETLRRELAGEARAASWQWRSDR